MGRAVSAGLFSKDWQGNDSLQRYEVAVVLGRLNLLASWREGTPGLGGRLHEGLRSTTGCCPTEVPGNDVLERDEVAVLLDRLATSDRIRHGAERKLGERHSRLGCAIDEQGRERRAYGLRHIQGSATVTPARTRRRARSARLLGRSAGQPVAAGGTWETGTPSWAHAAMGRAVSAGVLSQSCARR